MVNHLPPLPAGEGWGEGKLLPILSVNVSPSSFFL